MSGESEAGAPTTEPRPGRRRACGDCQRGDGAAAGEPTASGGIGMPGRVGVVDIGSNTVRLVVYDVPTRLPIPIFNEKAQCALGSGLGQERPAQPEGRRRGAAQPRLASSGWPTRWASTGWRWWRRRRCATPPTAPPSSPASSAPAAVPVHVLSGAEEARLAAVGLLNGVPGADGVLGDLGGGSLDLVSLDLRRGRPFRDAAARPPAPRRGLRRRPGPGHGDPGGAAGDRALARRHGGADHLLRRRLVAGAGAHLHRPDAPSAARRRQLRDRLLRRAASSPT